MPRGIRRLSQGRKVSDFAGILERIPFGIMIVAKNGEISYINREFENMTGYGYREVSRLEAFLQRISQGDERQSANVALHRAFEEGLRQKVGLSLVCKNGGERFFELIYEPLEEKDVLIWLVDMTPVKSMERELLRSERKFRSIFESSKDAIYIASYDGTFIDVNQAFCEMFGETKEEILKRNAKDAYVLESEKLRLKTALKRDGFVKDFEIKLRKITGEVMTCLLTVTALKDENGRIVQFHGIVRDITEKKKAEEKIRYMAFHDMLTGLPNRALFNDRLQMAIGYAKRAGEMVAVMILDLDKFKEINDTYGHGLGDEVLKEVARRLKSVVRKTDTIARMGGDEFLGAFSDIRRIEDIKVIGEKILSTFERDFIVNGKPFNLSASIGFSIYPHHGEDVDTLLSRADVAMYEVKQAGRKGFRIYNKE